jgi:hypothetical protein
MDKAEIRSALIEAGLGDVADKLTALARPAIRVATTPLRWRFDQPIVGSSLLGGQPDLPPGIAWPGSLSFIAQINLLQTVGYDAERLLPQQGLLYFFYNAQQQPAGLHPPQGAVGVCITTGFSALAPRAPQDKQPAFSPACSILARLTMPPRSSRRRRRALSCRGTLDPVRSVKEQVFGPTTAGQPSPAGLSDSHSDWRYASVASVRFLASRLPAAPSPM